VALKVSLANSILDKVFRSTDFTDPATVYMSIHSASPGDTGANEVTGYTGSRPATAFDAAASGHTQNTDVETYAAMPASTITHVGFWDAASGGNFLGWAALTASKVLALNDTLTFAAGDVDITIS
jgi:hypothetical protein